MYFEVSLKSLGTLEGTNGQSFPTIAKVSRIWAQGPKCVLRASLRLARKCVQGLCPRLVTLENHPHHCAHVMSGVRKRAVEQVNQAKISVYLGAAWVKSCVVLLSLVGESRDWSGAVPSCLSSCVVPEHSPA